MHQSCLDQWNIVSKKLDEKYSNYKILEVGVVKKNDWLTMLGYLDQNNVSKYDSLGFTPTSELNKKAVSEGITFPLLEKELYSYPIDNDTYDVVLSFNTFEHIEFIWLSFGEMIRCCKPGGTIIIQTVTEGSSFEYHTSYENGYPFDCWRFNIGSFKVLRKYINNCTDFNIGEEKIWVSNGELRVSKEGIKLRGFHDIWGMWEKI